MNLSCLSRDRGKKKKVLFVWSCESFFKLRSINAAFGWTQSSYSALHFWIFPVLGNLRKRCGRISFDLTCVKGAVSSTGILRDVEHFSGESSTFTVRGKQKEERKHLGIISQSTFCIWHSICTLPNSTSWGFSRLCILWSTGSGLFNRILKKNEGNGIH